MSNKKNNPITNAEKKEITFQKTQYVKAVHLKKSLPTLKKTQQEDVFKGIFGTTSKEFTRKRVTENYSNHLKKDYGVAKSTQMIEDHAYKIIKSITQSNKSPKEVKKFDKLLTQWNSRPKSSPVR